jgi:signal transduction histidine kinase
LELPKKTCSGFLLPSLARKYEGTGLGLSMVKRLAELQGGKVIARSELGKGSCFTVRIPLSVRLEGSAESVLK